MEIFTVSSWFIMTAIVCCKIIPVLHHIQKNKKDISHTKFLDLVIGSTLSWINKAAGTVNKLELSLLMLRYVKLLCPTLL